MSNAFNVSYNAGGTIDKVKNINKLESVGTIEKLGTIGSIQGFASKTQPYNKMIAIDVPASMEIIEEEITLPDKEVEILAISVTCSGYGEQDKYDLYFNDDLWFDNWYCSEVKEGLFLGSSTYVYSAPASSKLKIVFNNSSLTRKTLWVGVRMLVDKDEAQNEK